MNSNELKKEMNMKYEELTLYLQNKYGKPSRAYFRTTTCKSKSPITRGNEGLYIHHIKETEVDNLAQPEQAIEYPWEWQLPENLCYCNLLEHLLLHIHINETRSEEAGFLVIDGVLNHIVPELNHIYLHNPIYDNPRSEWRNAVKESVIENYEEYNEILTRLLAIIHRYIPSTTINILLNWCAPVPSSYPGAIMRLKGPRRITSQEKVFVIEREDGEKYCSIKAAARALSLSSKGTVVAEKQIYIASKLNTRAYGYTWKNIHEPYNFNE